LKVGELSQESRSTNAILDGLSRAVEVSAQVGQEQVVVLKSIQKDLAQQRIAAVQEQRDLFDKIEAVQDKSFGRAKELLLATKGAQVEVIDKHEKAQDKGLWGSSKRAVGALWSNGPFQAGLVAVILYLLWKAAGLSPTPLPLQVTEAQAPGGSQHVVQPEQPADP